MQLVRKLEKLYTDKRYRKGVVIDHVLRYTKYFIESKIFATQSAFVLSCSDLLGEQMPTTWQHFQCFHNHLRYLT